MPPCPVRSAFMAFMTRHNRQPAGWFEVGLAVLGFFTSIATISLVSKEVVSLMTSLALMLGMSTSILSLTLLATGNSVCVAVLGRCNSLQRSPSLRELTYTCCCCPHATHLTSPCVCFP
jgi:hypothetical protein